MMRSLCLVIIAGLAGFLGGTAAFSVLSPASVNANPVAQPLESNRFILLDGSGRKRGEWSVDKSGRVFLRMFDENGRTVWDTETRTFPLTR